MTACRHRSRVFGEACLIARSEARLCPLSTRLFPKFKGADAYALTGIAARCDWVVLSDRDEPKVADRIRTDIASVRTVFVSLRSHEAALEHFLDTVLPRLTVPFVLVSGSEDVTLPNQTDKRWPALPAALRKRLLDALDHPLLLQWFCENLDEAAHPKLRPLPLGMVFPEAGADLALTVPEWGAAGQRHRRILCAHRVRDGAQWDIRKQVTALAKNHWRSFVTVLEEPVGEAEFEALIRAHAFVLCVEGGGLDPSPKAWQTLLNGAVPIIRTTPVAAAYADFPIVQVDAWQADALSVGKLDDWYETHFRSGRVNAARSEIIDRLGLDYWWAQIEACLSTADPSSPAVCST